MALLNIKENKAYINRQQPAVTTPITNPVNPVQTKLPTQNLWMGNMEDVTRKAPTVATPKQPVISKTTNNSLVYDPNDPEDYLMKLQARGITGKVPTEQEYYQALQAQKALQARQASSTNPLQSQIDEMLRQQQEQKWLEAGRDTSELDAYRKQLDQQYGVQRDELLASGERQKTSAQNVYSFSWFGRSSAAANKMADIQKWVDWSIASLNAAKEAAIAAKRAELEWADSETLAALNSRVQQYQDAANKRQIESLQKTAEANQTSGASYIESLNNLMTTASKNGMDIGNPEDIQIYAQMARNPDWSINEEFVAALPQWMQAIIRTANIQQSKEAPKIENFGTTKSPRYMQRDGAKRVPVAWAGGWSMWWGGTGWGKWWVAWVVSARSELDERLTRIQDAVNNSSLPLSAVLLTNPDIADDLAYIRNNLSLKTFQDAKKAWVTFGAASNSEWEMLKKSATSLWNPLSSKEATNREINRLRWTTTPIKTTTPTATAPAAKKTITWYTWKVR